MAADIVININVFLRLNRLGWATVDAPTREGLMSNLELVDEIVKRSVIVG